MGSSRSFVFTPLVTAGGMLLVTVLSRLKIERQELAVSRRQRREASDGSLNLNYLSFTYRHPDAPEVTGRTFSGLLTHGQILSNYKKKT